MKLYRLLKLYILLHTSEGCEDDDQVLEVDVLRTARPCPIDTNTHILQYKTKNKLPKLYTVLMYTVQLYILVNLPKKTAIVWDQQYIK